METARPTVQAPLVPVTFAFLSGILLGTSAWLPPVSLIVVGAVSAGVSLWRWRRARSGVLVLLLLWGCIGALRMTVWAAHPGARLAAVLPVEPRPVRLHGVVVNDPAELFEPGEARAAEDGDATVDPSTRATAYGRGLAQDSAPQVHHKGPRALPVGLHPDRQVCVVALRHQKTAQGWQPICGRLRAAIHSPKQLVGYGDEVLVEGEWSNVPAPSNPGQYDWQAALARQRVHGLLRVRPFDGLVILRHGQGHPVLAAVFRWRARWARLIQEHFEPRDAALLLALLLGERAQIDEGLKEAFQTTGTVHLLVISGFNVGLVAGLLELCLRLLGWPWRLRLIGLAAGLGGYCLLSGGQPPVVRATLMAWIVLGAMALDRVVSWPNTLAAAAALILWVNPTQLFDPGFQLSFGAVWSLMALTPRWAAWLEPRLRGMGPAWLRRYVAASLCATSAVWVGLTPLLAWHFHLLSPISMVANLLLAPLVSALVSLGTAVLMAGTIVEPVVSWSRWPLGGVLEMTRRVVEWCHAIPGGHWVVPPPSPLVLVGYYGLLGISVLRRSRGWSVGSVALCWAGGISLWLWGLVASQAMASRWLRLEALDVGHGDCLVVRTPRGQTVLVDAGSEEAGRFRVVPFLRSAGITTIDALVLTHTDEDHVGGAVPVLSAVRVRRLLTNGAQGDTMSARAVRRVAVASGVPETVLAAGMRLTGDPAVRIEVRHPPAGLMPGVLPDSNDNSVVLRVAMGRVSVLLCGDIEEAGLPWLLRAGTGGPTTVLKIPHHGSRLGQAGEAFFDAVRPRVAMLSVGRAHHLPAPETVQALQRRGTAIVSTRDDGAVSLRTDGRRLEIRTFTGRHHTYRVSDE